MSRQGKRCLNQRTGSGTTSWQLVYLAALQLLNKL
jgi:hypothetical protein